MMEKRPSDLAIEYLVSNFWENMTSSSTTPFSTAEPEPLAWPYEDDIIIVDPPPTYSFNATTAYQPSNDQEAMNDLSTNVNDGGGLLWQNNLTPKPMESILDSQTSIHGNYPKNSENEFKGATSASSDRDQSGDDDDKEDAETDAGNSEQSLDPSQQSARRSRKRKQEHFTDLEFQAERLRGEKDSLCKQLANARQQFLDADTNNRVLKLDVESLIAKDPP
ncbi:hypothetical protein PTKIN_Ptkin19aG0135000 [Pterospermum kingtungense]